MFCQNKANNDKCLNLNNDRYSQQRHSSSEPQMSATFLNNCNNNPSMDQMLDRTPCGSATLSPLLDEPYDSPQDIHRWRQWSQSFVYLINDDDGVNCFTQFLQNEGLEQWLNFWFACKGLNVKTNDGNEDIRKLVNIIYKKFIRNPKTILLSQDVRNDIKQKMSSESDTSDPKYIFDLAQNEIEEQLSGSIYENFLRSANYLNYPNFIQLVQKKSFQNNHLISNSGSDKSDSKDINSDSSSSMESSVEDYSTQNQFYEVLPTVDEESELQTTTEMPLNSNASNSYLRSQTQNKFPSLPVNQCLNLMSSGSKETLLRGINTILSQRSSNNSSVRLSTESHPLSPNHNRLNTAQQSYLRFKAMANPPNPYHVKYATVLPTSARDSELQSISSHSTNDSMSCVGGHDNTSMRTKKQNFAIKQNAKLNCNANLLNFQGLNRPPKPSKGPDPAAEPDAFARILMDKMEKIKNAQIIKEKEDKKLMEFLKYAAMNNMNNNTNNKSNPTVRQPSTNASETSFRPNKTLKEVFKESRAENQLKFCPPEDNDQEILDKHIAQVFVDTPNETPTDSIGRCVSPPKTQTFRNFDNRMTPPVSGGMPSGFDTTQVNVTVKYSTEQIPYRLTLNGPNITLRKFKQQIPAKRGNWQYYFKRKCDHKEFVDISANYVLEKISDDNVLLPLIDGKIFAELQESN